MNDCPTCTGAVRRTVDMVCQTCGTDYVQQEQIESDLKGMTCLFRDFEGLTAQGKQFVRSALLAGQES